jgi:hypothetical protein
MVDLLVACAVKGDARAAIHLDERLRGRVKYTVQQGGDPDGVPIQVEHSEIPRYKVIPPGGDPRAR